MSFILDALRKSEKERQQGAVPGISDVPAVVHERRTPTWAVAVIAVLATGVLFLGWGWWQDRGSEPDVAAVRPGGLLPATTAVPPATDSGAVRNLAREPATASAAPTAAVTPVVTAPVTVDTQSEPETEAPAMVIGAPTMVEAIANGLPVPPLTLELHVYSAVPADRFVRINSASYREGEVLSEGPTVNTITEEGVILSFLGQNFLLSAD
jgi:general secretion pathway protein B